MPDSSRLSLCICPPPCRMVVLQTDGENWQTREPVLAIRTAYSDRDGFADELLLLIDDGWKQSVCPLDVAVIPSLPYRVVMCHWLPAEDPARFEPIYRELAAQASSKPMATGT